MDFLEYNCNDCPRRCGAHRDTSFGTGLCGMPSLPSIARAAPHFGEEPCISGTKGSGAVFFSGCNLRCVFCQNFSISHGNSGQCISPERLCDIFLELQDKGVHNINLVTPSHYPRVIRYALEKAELKIPVVWNSSGYDSVDTLKSLEGLVQIYLPDLKYLNKETARRYSAAPDYPETAQKAILEMFRQRGAYITDQSGIMQSGLVIRHLMLPGQDENTMNVIDFVSEAFPQGSVMFSLMAQYTPLNIPEKFPELNTIISKESYMNMKHYVSISKISDGYFQEETSATDEMIPEFDGTGV